MSHTEIIASAEAVNEGASFTTSMRAGGHAFLADEPEAVGGENKGPAPGDYLCAALASCKAITLRMYVQRKQWDVGPIRVRVNLAKADNTGSGLNTFYCEVSFPTGLTEEQKNRMLHVAKICPVDKLLSKPSEIVTTEMA